MAFASSVEIAPVEVNRAGVSLAAALTAADGTNGNKFHNDGKTLLRVKNADASPINVTVDTPGTVVGLAIADLVVSVPATTGDVLIGPFPGEFNQPGTDYVWVTFSAVTDVTIGAYRVANP